MGLILDGTSGISTTGNIVANNLTVTGSFSPASVSVTGNVTGNYILGNIAFANGIPATYSNADVAAYLSSGIAGNIIPSANNVYNLGSPTAQWASVYLNANTLYLGTTAVSSNNGNLVVNGNTVATTTSPGNLETAGNISATGNVTGNYILGNVAFATGIPATYGNSNVANYLPTYSGAFTASSVSATGNVTGNFVIGNGSLLTNLTGANVTGTVANATYATSAGSAVGTAATVTTAAQPNITSVGLLSSVSSTGTISTSGNVTGNYIIGNGSLLTNINAGNIVGAYSNANVAN